MPSPRLALLLPLIVLGACGAPPLPAAPGARPGVPPKKTSLSQIDAAAPAGRETATLDSPPPPAAAPCPVLSVELPALQSHADVPAEVPTVVGSPGAMGPFHEALARLFRGRAKDHVRIAVYGDSNLTRDFTTSGLRRTLQNKYGDAGHGFVALGRPWSHYLHMDVRHGPRAGWQSYAVTTHPIGDGGYGYSGIAAESTQAGATAFVGTVTTGPIGRSAGRAGVFYLKKAGYGRFSMRVDGEIVADIDTNADATTAAYYEVAMPEGPHEVDFVAETPRRVRLLGAVLESATPGVVVDSLGVGALNTRSQAHEDPAVNLAMLRRRPYDLVVFLTGTNDFLEMDKVPEWIRHIVAIHRAASPNVSFLFASPPDRGQYRSNEKNILVGLQRREIAAQNGGAFWDLWAAMGGRDSMNRFHKNGLGNPNDYVHFTEAGGLLMGQRLAYALLRDLQAHLAAHPEAGCDAAAAGHAESSRLN